MSAQVPNVELQAVTISNEFIKDSSPPGSPILTMSVKVSTVEAPAAAKNADKPVIEAYTPSASPPLGHCPDTSSKRSNMSTLILDTPSESSDLDLACLQYRRQDNHLPKGDFFVILKTWVQGIDAQDPRIMCDAIDLLRTYPSTNIFPQLVKDDGIWGKFLQEAVADEQKLIDEGEYEAFDWASICVHFERKATRFLLREYATLKAQAIKAWEAEEAERKAGMSAEGFKQV